MSTEQFVVTEGAVSNRRSVRILLRFINSLTLFKYCFPFSALLVLLATSSPQVFLWLTGEFSQCPDLGGCFTKIPYLGSTLHLNVELLCWVAVSTTILRLASWAACELTGQWSAQTIHHRMVAAVSHVRTTFYDENPSGRLINRLVRDFDNLRSTAVIRVCDTFHSLLEILCIAALIFLAHPVGAILVIPTIIAFFYLQQQIAPILQKCATLKAVRLSEVLHRETDIIEGSRAFVLYGKEAALLRRLTNALSKFVQIHITRANIEAWGRFWSSSVTTIYGFCTLSIVAIARHYEAISPVLAAVIITVIFRMSPVFGWFTWVSSYMIESIATARRVFEFIDLPDEVTEEFATPRSSAASATNKLLHGNIEFSNYSMSYRNTSPIILNKVSVVIPSGTRVGIVGRTGAGKTSLVQSLYRMVFVHGGDISIGGSSIFDYPIQYVREHFGVVPQDPYLFEGTVQSNLDRSGTVPKDALQEALTKVGLEVTLDTKIEEGGRNLSLGERQLLCLARVIVMNRLIVLMDEPTSSVDSITDAKIQKVLVTALAGRTVITIAHRLETLSRYDLIIELKEGRVTRVGTPGELLPSLSEKDLA